MSRAARAFLDRLERPDRLDYILARFSALPYENLTKLIKRADAGSQRRLPDEVLADHDRYGAGGTCFALTYFLGEILEQAGFQWEYLLADRSYMTAAHSALAVRIDGRRYLADPGYLLDHPLALDQTQAVRVPAPGEELLLEPAADGESWTLYTVNGAHRKFRYRLHSATVSESDFIDRWTDSFDWPMMDSLVLCSITREARHYLRDVHYHRVGANERFQSEVDPLQGTLLRDAFGIDPELFERARVTLY